MANHLPVLVYSKELIQNNTRSSFDEDEFEVRPPITTVIKSAEIKEGVLTIEIERIVPEALLPRRIEVKEVK